MKCLLVVDVQNGFITDATKHLKKLIPDLLSNFNDGIIIATKYINDDEKREKWSDFHEVKEVPDTDLCWDIAKYANYVFTKNTYSAITKEVKEILISKNITEVYLVGIATDCCILKSALDLFDMGIRPIVLAAYCGASDVLYHEQGLVILKRLIGEKQVIMDSIEGGI